MKRNSITTTKGLFSIYMQSLSAIIEARGRKMVTWDDAFASDPATAAPAVVMAWRGMKVAQEAAARGLSVILAPIVPTYFDYYQADDEREPLAIAGPK